MVENVYIGFDGVWQEKANELIAQGALTNSKRPSTFVEGVYPTHLTHGNGCFVFDPMGRRYFDFICALGSNLIGYANSEINKGITNQLKFGATLSLSSILELQLADKLKSLFPFVDCIKILKSGSEACSAAVKIARAYHGVDDVQQNVQEMWLNETFERISQGSGQDEWLSRTLQKLYSGIPLHAENQGAEEGGSIPLFQKPKGEGVGEEACPKAMGEGTDDRSECRSWQTQTRRRLRGTHQEVVRAMWKSVLARASSRLHAAPGSDMAMSGLPQQRARWLILSDGYHGHHDEFVSLTSPAIGVPEHFGILPLSGNEDLIPLAAAVIIEPILLDLSDDRIQFLKNLRDQCTRAGTLLIFDEVITGFRFPKFSVANYLGIEPDIIVLGKAIANGMPLAVVGGKKEIMNCDDYFVSSTFAGETISIRAAIETINLLEGPMKIEDLWKKGTAWLDAFNSFWPEKIRIEGYPTRGRFVGDELTRAVFFQEAVGEGLLFGPSWLFNFPLAEHSDETIEMCRRILNRMKTEQIPLRGKLPRSPFADRVRKVAG